MTRKQARRNKTVSASSQLAVTQRSSRGRKGRGDRKDELRKLARMLREGLNSKLAKCQRDCLAMLDSRDIKAKQRRHTSR